MTDLKASDWKTDTNLRTEAVLCQFWNSLRFHSGETGPPWANMSVNFNVDFNFNSVI